MAGVMGDVLHIVAELEAEARTRAATDAAGAMGEVERG